MYILLIIESVDYEELNKKRLKHNIETAFVIGTDAPLILFQLISAGFLFMFIY